MDEVDAKIYGYDIKPLILFANACRNAGVENDDLKEFARNVEFAWNAVHSEFENTVRRTIDIDDDLIHHVEYEPWQLGREQ